MVGADNPRLTQADVVPQGFGLAFVRRGRHSFLPKLCPAILSYLGHTPRVLCSRLRATDAFQNNQRGNPMEFGYFTMPSHPPECGLYEGHRLGSADPALGRRARLSARPGSASTTPRPGSRIPSPDLLIAQALMETRHIRLGPGGFLLPYHHPAELANRVAMLDHMAQGRLNFGVAASGLPSDWAMFNVDGNVRAAPRDDARGARHHPASCGPRTSPSITPASTGR